MLGESDENFEGLMEFLPVDISDISSPELLLTRFFLIPEQNFPSIFYYFQRKKDSYRNFPLQMFSKYFLSYRVLNNKEPKIEPYTFDREQLKNFVGKK